MQIDPTRTAGATELLQTMIRNECVNDGTLESGDEIRNSDLLETYLEGSGLDCQHYDSAPGRRSIVSRIEGSDPDAPSLCLMGHTDVVPVTPSGWSRDPFAGELIDGEVWGRGAIDMLSQTAAMAVAFKHLATTGFQPKGDLIFFGVADEEAGGNWGARWMIDNNLDAVKADYVITEWGGVPSETPNGMALTLNVAEKGVAWQRLKLKGTPSHGSMPWGADNALIKAAEVVRRLAEYRPTPDIHNLWRELVKNLHFDADTKDAMLDPDRLDDALAGLDDQMHARTLHACSHTTFSPNVVHGGSKTNTVPDEVIVEVDIRTLPGETPEDIQQHLRTALGEALYNEVEVEPIHLDMATASPLDTPLWDVLSGIMKSAHPGAHIQPSLITGGTDARFYRAAGSVAYGASLFSAGMRAEVFADRFHGNDERIDVESIGLTTELFVEASKQMLT
ncbi:MAG: M20/M25/M40 family metallo-hydrolase [Acidimicrobiales bacterium]|jgi:acetylornithine deacetylase/succinyl-diaminopimelate desuccinylase-like protein